MKSKYYSTWVQRMAALVVVLLGSISTMLADTKLYIEDFSISAGETKKVAVCLDTDESTIYSVKMTLALPAGLQLVADGNKIKTEIASERTGALTMESSVANGNIMFSDLLRTSAIDAGKGPIFYVFVKETALVGSGAITISNVELKRQDKTEVDDVVVTGSTVSKNGSTAGGVSVAFDNSEVTMGAGETKTISVSMDNTGKEIQGFQATLVLPDGWTAAVTGPRGAVSYNDATGKIVNMTGITGISGAVLNITLTAPATFVAGSVPVKLTGIKATVNYATVNLSEITSTVNATSSIAEKPTVAFAAEESVIYPGKTASFEVNMTNSGIAVDGFQADLVLPTGWTATVSGIRGEYSYNAGTGRIMNLVGVPGDEGAMFALTLTAPANFEGEANIQLTNMKATINMATVNLDDATMKVLDKHADKETALAALKDEITAATTLLGEADKTVEPGKSLSDAIAAAQGVVETAEADMMVATVEELNAANETLKTAEQAYQDAVKAAEEKAAAKQALTDEITAATTLLGEADKTVEPGKSLNDAIVAAQAVLANEETTTEQYNEAVTTLKAAEEAYDAAVKAAEKAAAKGALTDEVVAATTLLGDADKTVEPGKSLNDAINAAKAVLTNDESTTEQLKAAVETLKAAEEAYDAAVKAAEQAAAKTALSEEIAKANDLVKDDPAPENEPAKSLMAAIEAAQKVLDATEPAATTKELVDATEALKAAENAYTEASAETFPAIVKKAMDGIEEGQVAYVNLNKDFEVNSPVEVPAGKQLVVNGKNNKLTLGAKGNFVLNDGITLKNMTIEAAALTQPLISLSSTPATAPNPEKANFYEFGDVKMENVTIKGMKKAVVKSNAKYLVKSIAVEGSNIELAAAVTPFDFGGGQYGYPTVLSMKNSTLWASVSNNKPYFSSQSGNSPKDINNGAEETQTISFENSTLYNISYGANFNNLRQKGQKFLIFPLKNNIFVNCGKDNLLQGIDGGQNSTNPKWTNENNTFGKIVEDVYTDLSAAQTNCGEVINALTTDPTFADAANGDFTIGASTKQAKFATGDPRWVVEYVKPAFSALVAEALAAVAEGNATLTLEEDYTVDAAVTVPAGKQLVLDGANHSLTLGEATNFTICDGITIKNVNIDAAALTKPLVQMNGTPEIEPVESGQYVIKNAITIDNVKVTGLTKNLFSDGGKGYAYDQFNINNSVFEYATQTGVVLNLAASMAINFNITNSTFYSKEAGTANFIAMSGKRPWQITGYEDETGKLTVANNTFYNVAKSKQFMNTNTLKGQKYLYEFNSNIFANVSNKKLYGNMTNNKKQLTTDGKNTYFFDGEFFAETNFNGDEGLKTDPAFADVATGDFTIGASTAQAKEATGDPRWVVEYVKADFNTLVQNALDAVESGEATLTLIDSYDVTEVVTVPAGKQLTIDGAANTLTLGEATNFVLNDGITLKNMTIEAAALTQPLISLSATPATAPNPEKADFYEFGDVKMENVTIKGMKKAVVKSNAKYLVKSIAVEGSNIELAAAVTPFDFGGGQYGYPTVLSMKNSTLWASVSNNKPYFSSQSGNSPKDINNGAEETQTISFENSTLYNISYGANFNNLRQKGQKFLIFPLKNNIFVNCGKDNLLQGIDGGQNSTNPKWTYENNTFGKIVEDVYTDLSAAQTNCGEVINALTTDPTFADAANGDFTIGATTMQAREATGDPRWVVPFVAPTDVDKTVLAATITEAEALTAPAESDPEEVKTAWAAVTDALTKGQAVNADANVFQDEVDAANTALADAIAAYNTATGITEINIDNNTVAGEKDVYYNLQGVRVANPGKGIYIKNGKKVLVK